jgi:uncharacterized membrane protein
MPQVQYFSQKKYLMHWLTGALWSIFVGALAYIVTDSIDFLEKT